MDLHMHSNLSDGKWSVQQIIKYFSSKGYKIISITDHNTIAGYEQASLEEIPETLKLIPGIEVNTVCESSEIHILGYFFDKNNSSLVDLIDSVKNFRVGRIKKIIDKLKNFDILLDFDYILDKNQDSKSLGRPHVARELVSKGFCRNEQDAFERFLGAGQPAFVQNSNELSPFEAVEVIAFAGGIPVIAHPGLSRRDELIPSLIKHGLRGIEAFHPGHMKEEINYYVNLAEKKGLQLTIGSDMHSEFENFTFYELLNNEFFEVCNNSLELILKQYKIWNSGGKL